MLKPHFTQEQLVQAARLSDGDFEYLASCRGAQNKIGSAYQLCYIKLFNRFPVQVHQLARDITYGNRGRFKGKSLEEISNSGNCTALLIAAITYWQAKEISRVIRENDPEETGIDISLLAYVSPIEWTNVILYGEYRLNRNLVK
jgi:hypothetical protein